jgi:uncharacterized membrane protein
MIFPGMKRYRPSLWSNLTVLLVILIGMVVAYASRQGDFVGYVSVGELVLNGGNIYSAPEGCNNWPPFFSLFCVPLALLARVSLYGSHVFWLALNLVALLFACYAAVWLVHGRRLHLGALPGSREDGIDIRSNTVMLPLLFCGVWILSNFEHLQINILIFAIALVGLVFHRQGHDVLAGLFIGMGGAMKILPILFLPYFLWRRQWRVALYTGVFAVVWSVLPAAEAL